MKFNILALVAVVGSLAGTQACDGMPDRFSSPNDDALMRLLISKGFAKEKEDNIDSQCGVDCTCCQKRQSQYWINRAGAEKAAKAYVGKHLHLSGPKLDEFITINFAEKWMQFDVLQTGEIEIE